MQKKTINYEPHILALPKPKRFNAKPVNVIDLPYKPAVGDDCHNMDRERIPFT